MLVYTVRKLKCPLHGLSFSMGHVNDNYDLTIQAVAMHYSSISQIR